MLILHIGAFVGGGDGGAVVADKDEGTCNEEFIFIDYNIYRIHNNILLLLRLTKVIVLWPFAGALPPPTI